MGQSFSTREASEDNTSLQSDIKFAAHYAEIQLLERQRDRADRRSLLLAHECKSLYYTVGCWNYNFAKERAMLKALKKASLDSGGFSLEILDRELQAADERGEQFGSSY